MSNTKKIFTLIRYTLVYTVAGLLVGGFLGPLIASFFRSPSDVGGTVVLLGFMYGTYIGPFFGFIAGIVIGLRRTKKVDLAKSRN